MKFCKRMWALGQLTVNVTEHFARYVDFAPEKVGNKFPKCSSEV